MCEADVKRSPQLKITMYTARLKPPLSHNRRWSDGEGGTDFPSQPVQRSTASIKRPATINRVLPTQTGGHEWTRYLMAVLLPPHKKIVKRRLATMAR